MHIGILGPLEVSDEGRVLDVPGARARRLLLRLVVGAGHVVSADELVDAVWPDDPPGVVANALQSLVSRLRRALPGCDIVQQSHGYRVDLSPHDLDVDGFLEAAENGNRQLARGDHVAAARTLADGLALWRGQPLQDAGGAPYTIPLVVEWEERRLQALAARIEADLDNGAHASIVAELESLVASHPVRQVFTSLLMRALQADGRANEALVAFERLRGQLADELGTDPSAALREQHLQLLRETSPAVPGPLSGTNLPTPLTPFLGREEEVARVRRLLRSGRLVTIVGAGGAGKTRLATELARDWRDAMPDGVWLVELAPVGEPGGLAMAFLGTLGLHEAHVIEVPAERASVDPVDRLLERLRSSRCLLVVDNCEHLIDGVAELLATVLSRCPGVRVVATSREPLAIDGEALCVLPPLSMPAVDATVADALALPAVQLFVQRAESVDAGFRLDSTTLPSVVEIVRRLDGMPLPIELAAARLRVLPVAEIAARLSDRFRLLTGASRSALPRHRTLRAVVEWSWDLLSDRERLLCERLAVFPSGATQDSAAAVCSDDLVPHGEVPELLASLVDKSLLNATDESGLRYRMLETIREYGVERLAEREEEQAARSAHAHHYAAMVTTLEPQLRTAEQLSGLATLLTERDNIAAALRFLADSGDAEAAVELALALSWYWMMLGAHVEAHTWLGLALSAPGEVEPRLRVLGEAVHMVNSVAVDAEATKEWAATVAKLHDLDNRLDDWEFAEPLVLVLRPMLAFFGGDNVRGMQLTEQALTSSDPWVRTASRTLRVSMAENLGDVELMRSDLAAAAADIDIIGDRWLIGSYLSARARARTFDGDLDGAIEDYERALRGLIEIGSLDDRVMIGVRLADLRLRGGDIAGARREADLAFADNVGALMPMGLFRHAVMASIARSEGDLQEAERLKQLLRRELDEMPTQHPVLGHVRAMIGSGLAMHEITCEHLDEAAHTVASVLPVALGTKDMPIVAAVGVAIADLLRARGELTDAARLLGAAAALRGSDDPTDLEVRRISEALRSALGQEYAAAFASGRTLTNGEATALLESFAAAPVAAVGTAG